MLIFTYFIRIQLMLKTARVKISMVVHLRSLDFLKWFRRPLRGCFNLCGYFPCIPHWTVNILCTFVLWLDTTLISEYGQQSLVPTSVAPILLLRTQEKIIVWENLIPPKD
jgi:hypothetical protein